MHPWSTWWLMALRDQGRTGSGGRAEVNGKRLFIARVSPTPFTRGWTLSRRCNKDERKLYTRRWDGSQDKDDCNTGTGGGG